MSTTKKKRIGSRRLLNQNLHETHEPVDMTNSMVAQELPEKNKDSLLSPNSAPSERTEITGSRRKLGSTRGKVKEQFTDFTTESQHKPREEVAENTKYLPAPISVVMDSLTESLQTENQTLGRNNQVLAQESEMVVNEGLQFTTEKSLNAQTKAQPIKTKSQGSAIEDTDDDPKSGRLLNDGQSEPEIGRAQQGVLKEREAKQMPDIPKVTFPPAAVTGERTCSVKLMESEEISGVHNLSTGSDDANTKHDTEGLYQKREDEELKHTTGKTVNLQSEHDPLPTANIRRKGSNQRRKENKQVYDDLQQQCDEIVGKTEVTTVQSNTSQKEVSTETHNKVGISAKGVKYKEEDQVECYSSLKEEMGLDNINEGYNLPTYVSKALNLEVTTPDNETDESMSQETQLKDFSSENENKDKCSLNPTGQRNTAQEEDQEQEIKQSDEQHVLLQKEEPAEVGESLSSVQILHTDINAPLTSTHQDTTVSGENLPDAGSQLLKNKRKLGSSRKIKGRKQHDERSEEDITPNEAIETTQTEPVIKEQSPETAVDNVTFEAADQSNTTEASYQQPDKDISDAQYNRRSEEDPAFRPVSHITEDVSTEEREQTQLESVSQSEIYLPPKEQMSVQQITLSSENETYEERDNVSVKPTEQDKTNVIGADVSSVEQDLSCPGDRNEKDTKDNSLEKEKSEPDQVYTNEDHCDMKQSAEEPVHQKTDDNAPDKERSESVPHLDSEVSAPNTDPHLGLSRRKLGTSRRTKGSKHATGLVTDVSENPNLEVTTSDNEAICSTENKDVAKVTHLLQLSPTEEMPQKELCDEQPVLLQKEEPSEVGESLSSVQVLHTDINAPLTSTHQDTTVRGEHFSDAGSQLLKNKRKLGSSRKIKGRKQHDERSEEDITPNEAIETTQTEPVIKEQSPEVTHLLQLSSTEEMPQKEVCSFDFVPEGQIEVKQQEDVLALAAGYIKPAASVKYKDEQQEMHSSSKGEKDWHQINEDAAWTAAKENSSHRKQTETVMTDKEQTANEKQDSYYRLCSLTAAEQSDDSVVRVKIPEMTTQQHRRKIGSSRREKRRQNVEDSEGKFSKQFLCPDDEAMSQENQKEITAMEEHSFTIKGLKEDHTEADDSPGDTASLMDNTKSEKEMTTESDTSHEDIVRTDRFDAPQTAVMSDAGDSFKNQQGSDGIDILDSSEKLQINSEQKRRKMGSTRKTQLNRKQQEVVNERNLKTDNVIADELLVTSTENENSKPLPSVMERQEASVAASSIIDQQNEGVSELHSKETKERLETAHEEQTEDAALILEMVTGATEHDMQRQSVCPSTGNEMKHSSPDLSLTDKKRKMGSTRKNLRKSKGEKEENESAVNVFSEVVLSSSGEKVENQDVEGKGENYFETVEHSSIFSGTHSVHQRPDDQLNNAEHLTSECISKDQDNSSKTGAMTEAGVVVKKRKMGSHRKPHGDQNKGGPGEVPTDESVIQTLVKHKEESSTLEQIPEVIESDIKALSSSSTSSIKVESKPVSERPSEQIQPLPSSKVHLAQQSKIQLSIGQGASVGASKYEVVMIGDSSVGKTSFIKRVESGKFSFDLPASVGLDSYTWTVVVDGKNVVLHLWDTAGQERFHSMTKQIFHRAQAFLLMYDITCAQSFSAVSYWANSIKERAAEDAVILLLGNKSDSTERQVKKEEGEILAQGYNFAFMECSAATGENIIEALETIARLLSQKAATREEAMVLHKKPQQRNKFGCC